MTRAAGGKQVQDKFFQNQDREAGIMQGAIKFKVSQAGYARSAVKVSRSVGRNRSSAWRNGR